jgi:hypothetical protein
VIFAFPNKFPIIDLINFKNIRNWEMGEFVRVDIGRLFDDVASCFTHSMRPLRSMSPSSYFHVPDAHDDDNDDDGR